jgi:hypothetical protein
VRGFIGGIVAACALVLGMAAIAWAISPETGIYQGIIDGSPNVNGHNEGEGYFKVKNTSTGKKIVPYGTYIVAPNNLTNSPYPHCDPYNADLDTSRIPISQGAFDFRGYTAQPPSSGWPRYHIRFKGAWVSQKKVKGFTRITKGTCDTGKMPWTMRTPPPP